MEIFLLTFNGQPHEYFTSKVDAIAAVLHYNEGAEVKVRDLGYKIKFRRRYAGEDKFKRSHCQILVIRHG